MIPQPAPGQSPQDRLTPLLPQIEATAPQTERTQRLATIDALRTAGLFRLLMPLSVDGLQTTPATFLDIVERAGQADASTGWSIAQTSVCSMAAARLPKDVATTIFTPPDAILAWGFGPPGRATPHQGGWRIQGTWSFGSAAHHATWLGGACALCDQAGTPVQDPSGHPVTRMMLFPQHHATFTPTWDVIGLRGTGSDTYAVDSLTIPESQAFQFGALVQPHARAPLYALPPDSLWAAGFASVALGVAQATHAALQTLAAIKTPRAQPHPLSHSPATQTLIAETRAALQAARLLLHHTVETAHHQAERSGAVTLDARMSIRLAASHAIRTARDTAERCYHAAGTTAVFATNPFERRVRDMHMISQHVHGRQQHFETVGAHLLGLSPDLAFL